LGGEGILYRKYLKIIIINSCLGNSKAQQLQYYSDDLMFVGVSSTVGFNKDINEDFLRSGKNLSQ
jgi:hypothetical protein